MNIKLIQQREVIIIIIVHIKKFTRLSLYEAALSVALCPSVCPSVRPMSTESLRNFKLGVGTALDMSSWESKFEVRRSNAKVTRNENAKFCLLHISVKSGSIYIKPRPMLLSANFTLIVNYISSAETHVVLRYLSVCLSVTYHTYLPIIRIETPWTVYIFWTGYSVHD